MSSEIGRRTVVSCLEEQMASCPRPTRSRSERILTLEARDEAIEDLDLDTERGEDTERGIAPLGPLDCGLLQPRLLLRLLPLLLLLLILRE